MLYSMTGFGKAVAEIPGKKITVEIKSLNSKQMDVATRVPYSLRAEELAIRNFVGAALERGKIDLTVYVETAASEGTVKLNVPVMKSYKAEIENAAAELGIPVPDDWYGALMRLPDVLKNETPAQADDLEVKAVMEAISEATDSLLRFRRTEGEKLEAFFAERIEKIRSLLALIPQYETERIERIRVRMEEGLAKVHNADYDRSRLEQELFFYIEKLDINEEKQRLTQHLNYFTETMDAPKGQGKKLGFISQEMGREINTLGSKSNHAEMQRIVVQMKDALEQIKEQVLNVM